MIGQHYSHSQIIDLDINLGDKLQKEWNLYCDVATYFSPEDDHMIILYCISKTKKIKLRFVVFCEK